MNLEFLRNFDFFAGVPDSQLKPLCDYLMDTYGVGANHIIGANEGNCVALATGYHLATGKVPVVYLQNSGIGSIINPVASLLNDKIYGIPCIFFVGWRGEPGLDDEPQHVYQGEVTIRLLEDMDIRTYIIDKNTTQEAMCNQLASWQPLLNEGKQVAIVVRKNALQYSGKTKYANAYAMSREKAIRHIALAAREDIIVSTTGKASRELFEIRESNGQGHSTDFLTVGSMGHSSSIALGIALQLSNRNVWCIDGDGAALMHMGAMAVIGANAPKNMIHIVINNGAHESVGGMPTVAGKIDLIKIAQGCGYPHAVRVQDFNVLDDALKAAKERAALSFIEVMADVGAREDLCRPTVSAQENKRAFMQSLRQ